MCEDSDQDISELDIASKTWDKLEKNMTLVGFREGAAKGREVSIQQGFDLGYHDGFRVGEYLGIFKGFTSCTKELGISESKSEFDEKDITALSNEACILCLKDNKQEVPELETTEFNKLENIILRQNVQSKKLFKHFENTDLETFLDVG